MIDISIIIPFKNHIKQLERCLSGIITQKINLNYEIIILDSSADDFSSILNRISSKIIHVKIPGNEFNHGQTRNVGVNHANGKILVFTVQDAIPVGFSWLRNLVEPLIEYRLDAICGLQMSNPNGNTNPVGWHRPIDEPCIKIVKIDSIYFNNLSSDDKLLYTCWDNVNAAYSKESLIKIPFRPMMFGEDAQWSVDAINSNFKIGYTSHTAVFHDHVFDFQFCVNRTLAEFYTKKITIDLNPVLPKINCKIFLIWVYVLLKSKISPIMFFYWIWVNMRQVKAKKVAFGLWNNLGYSEVVKYLTSNVPMSKE